MAGFRKTTIFSEAARAGALEPTRMPTAPGGPVLSKIQLACSSADLALHDFEAFMVLPPKGWCGLCVESPQIGVALADPHKCPRLTVRVEPAMSFPNLLMQVIEAQPEVQSHVQNMHSESRADNQAFPPSQIFMNDRE